MDSFSFQKAVLVFDLLDTFVYINLEVRGFHLHKEKKKADTIFNRNSRMRRFIKLNRDTCCCASQRKGMKNFIGILDMYNGSTTQEPI